MKKNTRFVSASTPRLKPRVLHEEIPTVELARIKRLVNGADKFLMDALLDDQAPKLSDRARAYIDVARKATAAALSHLYKDQK